MTMGRMGVALCPLAVGEPIAVPVPRRLIPFRRVDPGEPDFPPGDANAVPLGHIGLAGENARGRASAGTFPQSSQGEEQERRKGGEGNDFYYSCPHPL